MVGAISIAAVAVLLLVLLQACGGDAVRNIAGNSDNAGSDGTDGRSDAAGDGSGASDCVQCVPSSSYSAPSGLSMPFTEQIPDN